MRAQELQARNVQRQRQQIPVVLDQDRATGTARAGAAGGRAPSNRATPRQSGRWKLRLFAIADRGADPDRAQRDRGDDADAAERAAAAKPPATATAAGIHSEITLRVSRSSIPAATSSS